MHCWSLDSNQTCAAHHSIWPRWIQPIFKLLHSLLIHQQLLYGTVTGKSVTGTTAVQVDTASVFTISTRTVTSSKEFTRLVTQDFPLVKQLWMLLVVCLSLMSLENIFKISCYNTFVELSQGDQPMAPWVLLLALLEASSDICFSQVFWRFSRSPWWIKDYGPWP